MSLPHINTVVGTREIPFAPGVPLRDIPAAEAGCRRLEIVRGELRKPTSRFRCESISSGEAKEICGPGFVGVIAALRNSAAADRGSDARGQIPLRHRHHNEPDT
jgi:hypothetical protein